MEELQTDLREFIELLNSHDVEYAIIGGYAVVYHGLPRYTQDIDFLIRISEENARRIVGVLRVFGFAALGLTERDFLEPDQIVQLGVPPFRIDLVTSIAGVESDQVFARRLPATLGGVPVWFIDRESLILNKRSTGRLRDLADAEAIE